MKHVQHSQTAFSMLHGFWAALRPQSAVWSAQAVLACHDRLSSALHAQLLQNLRVPSAQQQSQRRCQALPACRWAGLQIGGLQTPDTAKE